LPSWLSSLDSSFLRVETPSAHMHVARRGGCRPHATRARPPLDRLRASVGSRVRRCRRIRQRLAYPPLGMGEPYRDRACFGIHAEPVTLLEARELPGSLRREVRELAAPGVRSMRVARHGRRAGAKRALTGSGDGPGPVSRRR